MYWQSSVLFSAIHCTNLLQNTHVTLSIGAASSDQGETSFEVVQKADQSLYQAKQTGRNKVVGYSEE